MSPLSVLPGRVRYRVDRLIGCQEGSLQLEESLLAAPGVLAASASHRTGTVLVRFDEALVNRDQIEGRLGRALEVVPAPGDAGAGTSIRRRPHASGPSVFNAGSLAIEVALHALLPAPLDLLLPAAATVLRR